MAIILIQSTVNDLLQHLFVLFFPLRLMLARFGLVLLLLKPGLQVQNLLRLLLNHSHKLIFANALLLVLFLALGRWLRLLSFEDFGHIWMLIL